MRRWDEEVMGIEIIGLLRQVNEGSGVIVVVVTHDHKTFDVGKIKERDLVVAENGTDNES